MSERVSPLTKEHVPELAEGFRKIEAILGFVPNSNLIMARHPALLQAFQRLAVAALDPVKVDRPTKMLAAHMTSRAAGCGYCIAHTGHVVEKLGVPVAKLESIWEYEHSDLFTPAERAVLEFARAAALVPNAVSDAMFDELKRFFDEDQIVELVGVVALYGFLNRWNDTLATELERSPLEFARRQKNIVPNQLSKHTR
jgi:uncharacterized peroxidase-related enzyme